jgi:D-glycero-D-manno-heptose 1,7-bisphosphate phosphatase
MNRAVFLDRDGTLNAMVYHTEFGLVDSPANPGEFKMLPQAGDAVRMINRMGLLAIVISNQPGIAKGKFSVKLLEAMTQIMMDELNAADACIDAVYYCYHHPEGIVEEFSTRCDCRKPSPGLLVRAASEMDIDLHRSYFIGDGITDMQAGQAAGTTNVLLYPSTRCYVCEELARRQVRPDYIAKSLIEAVELIRKIENG